MTNDEYHDICGKSARVYDRYHVMGLMDFEWAYYGKVGGNVINGVPIDAVRETLTPGCPERVQKDISAELQWLGVYVLFTVRAEQPSQVSWVYANADEVQAAWQHGDGTSCTFVCGHWQREAGGAE